MQWVRRLTRRNSSKAPAADLDPLSLSAFKVAGYMSLTAGACADALLDKWPTLAGKTAGPAVSYSVYSQFLFLYLHLMDRMAFAEGGDQCRVAVRELVGPHLVSALNAYLSGRHSPPESVPSSELTAIVGDFFEMLTRSEFSFSRLPDYPSMMDEVTKRLSDAWELRDLEALGEIVRGKAGTRGHALQPLLSEVIRRCCNGPSRPSQLASE